MYGTLRAIVNDMCPARDGTSMRLPYQSLSYTARHVSKSHSGDRAWWPGIQMYVGVLSSLIMANELDNTEIALSHPLIHSDTIFVYIDHDFYVDTHHDFL